MKNQDTGEMQKIFLQVLQDKEEDHRRLEILKQIKGMNGVSQLIFYWYKPVIINNVTDLHASDQHILNGQIFVFYEYCSYNQLSIETFNDYSLSSSYDLVKAQMDLFYKMCQIIYELNQRRIYHFDIQPENILTNGHDVVIIDFGAAQQFSQDQQDDFGNDECMAFTYIQTPAFSPYKYDFQNYQIQADKYDVYSLGCVLYFMLTKQYLLKPLSMDNHNTYELQQQYGWEIFTLIQQMTEVDAMYRFSIEDVINHPIFNPSLKNQTKIINYNPRFKVSFQYSKRAKCRFGIKELQIKSISTDCMQDHLNTIMSRIHSVQGDLNMPSELSDYTFLDDTDDVQYIRYNTMKYYLQNGIDKLSAFKNKNRKYISRSLSNQYSSENISTEEQYFDDTYVERIRNQLNNRINIQLKYFIPDYLLRQKRREYDQSSFANLKQEQKDYFQQIQVNKKINNYINQYLPQQLYYISLQKKITRMIYESQVDYNKFIKESSDSEDNMQQLNQAESKLSKNASDILSVMKNIDRNSMTVTAKTGSLSKTLYQEALDFLSDVVQTDDTYDDPLMSTSPSSQSFHALEYVLPTATFYLSQQ